VLPGPASNIEDLDQFGIPNQNTQHQNKSNIYLKFRVN